jgi:PAS domain S-box-containing protein
VDSGKTRVFLIEDNPGDARLIRDLLTEAGNSVFDLGHADCLSTGLKRLAEGDIDVLLLDLSLPDSQGLDSLSKVLAKAPKVPIVVMSGLEDESVAIKAVQEGAQDYLVKGSVDAKLLARSLRYAIERHRLQQALRHSEEYFRALTENSQDAIAILDSNGTIRYEGPSIERILGYEPQDRVGKSAFELIHPEDMSRVVNSFAELMRKPRSTLRAEVRLQHKDGSWRTFEAVGNNLLDDPAVRGVVANFRDITERKQAEEALRESEEKLKHYLDSSPEAILICDTRGNFLYGNRVAQKIMGYSSEELVGKNWQKNFALSEESLSKGVRLMELSARKRTGPNEFELVGKDGSHTFVEVSTYPIGQRDKVEIISIARDITERKRLEEQLRLAGRLVAVGELAVGVAHELNNPLAAIQGFAQLLTASDHLDKTLKKDLETIYREAQRASKITGSLLSFARQHKPEKHLISIDEVIEKTLELRVHQMQVNNIEVVVDFAADLPKTMADFSQMQQVFVNIINNAEQAMLEAHGRGKLIVKTERSGEMIQIAFTDSGPGISEENLNRIFDPFFTTKEVGKGTGLGLSICYGIVQAHGGRIYAKSKLGRGATFVVEIPITSEYQPVVEQEGLTKGGVV